MHFRWLSKGDLGDIFNLLFHIARARDEDGYKEKQKMLAALINAGLPYDVFLLSMDMSLEENLMKEAKDKGLEEPDRARCTKVQREMPRKERKAREFLHTTCVEYNAVTKPEHQKNIEDFYKYLTEMWSKLGVSQGNTRDGDGAFQPWWDASRSDYPDEGVGRIGRIHGYS